jgi:hypothetical protein
VSSLSKPPDTIGFLSLPSLSELAAANASRIANPDAIRFSIVVDPSTDAAEIAPLMTQLSSSGIPLDSFDAIFLDDGGNPSAFPIVPACHYTRQIHIMGRSCNG